MKIITIIGARPQFVKAAMVSRAVMQRKDAGIKEYILHTGQHYDTNMSDIFFKQLDIPQPTWQLHCGEGSHASMTAQMLVEIENILRTNTFDYALVYGDTNSTLAGALAAVKLHIPVIHIEAGLRSFNKQMPEEINRILTDHVSTLLFCPTAAAVRNLHREGINEGVYHVGDVMYDAALTFGRIARQHSRILASLNLNPRKFYLCTIHRAENTDDSERLTSIIRALIDIATDFPVVLPLHPRTRICLEKYGLLPAIASCPSLRPIEPVDYFDMVMLEQEAAAILTDSGGVQKEAFFHRTPCITLRDETEWTETVDCGWNQPAGWRTENIIRCLHTVTVTRKTDIPEYGSGNAAGEIIDIILGNEKSE
ncbi:MAG: UDP-N-acetylglucosamine 2-epimerase (non-hydrolyzing) [Tannerella sp.]|jgi:UDP-GlcNAc3NAcA epimerase|nr:UDP-N-acetylglucosamine 2-epimerase (non-hydrolyzing) [Tannerella sp.]